MLIVSLTLQILLVTIASAETTAPTSLPTGGLSGWYRIPIPEDEDCTELKPGQSKVIKQSAEKSHSGVGGHYKVTRLRGKRSYRIDLNIRYKPSALVLHNAIQLRGLPFNRRSKKKITEELQFIFQWKAQSCANMLQGRLRSKDDTNLKIFINSKEARYKAPKTTIEIRDHKFKNTDYKTWASAIPCTVVLHELFHHLGLPDGYASNLLNAEELHKAESNQHSCSQHTAKASCRHIEPPGIMNRYESFTRKYYDGLMCKPKIPTTNKLRSFKSVKTLPPQCPQGYKISNRTRVGKTLEEITPGKEKKDGILIYYARYTPPSPLMLGNAHIKQIISPKCVSQNRVYLTCIQNAGRTKGNCLNTPAYCDGDFIN